MNKSYFLFLLLVPFLFNCKSESTESNPGKLSIKFSHNIEGQEVVLDSLIYINEAGNHYEINELMYFISDVNLYRNDGLKLHIEQDAVHHFIDILTPETWVWNVADPIPAGTYDSISFIFGLNEERNIPNYFVNPPEIYLFWPEVLGGGYHYMMLNGRWKNLENEILPFNFHMGIGQIYAGNSTNTDSITGFVQNYFEVKLPLNQMVISSDSEKIMVINMNIESWFKTPHTWDFNYWGGAIMQNQEAMNTAKENGIDVFTIDKIY